MCDNKVSVFLPCRAGSERVPQKNIRKFGPFKRGLLEIKLNQLLNVSGISQVFLSTNDDEIIRFGSSLGNPKLIIHKRASDLCLNTTATDALVAHAASMLRGEHILWTHVTSPFYTSECYQYAIDQYFKAITERFDSLMSVNTHKNFFFELAPENTLHSLNFTRVPIKWPRTQDIKPLFEVNSACFISHESIYTKNSDRIGSNPYLLPTNTVNSIDIDWQDDFSYAEKLLLSGIAST